MSGAIPFASNVVVLALVVAALWGVSDFLGGLATRRARVLPVVVVAHGLSLLLLVLAAFAAGARIPSERAILWGLVTGLCSGVAVIAFYTALAIGEMGLTAAFTGLLTAVIPVAFAFFTEGRPKGTQLLGFALAAVAIWLLAYEPAGRPHARGLGLATLAGVGFGTFLITSKFASNGAVLWPLACSRLASASLAASILVVMRMRARLRPAGNAKDAAAIAEAVIRQRGKSSSMRMGFLLAAAAGSLEALANMLYMLATHAGRLDVAAVLSSLYPAGTILLAIWLLKERLSARKACGIVLALAAALVISL